VPGDGPERLARAGDVQRNLAAQEVGGVDPSGDDIGVGHRRLAPAAPVTGRPRHRARALRTDVQATGLVDPGDRPTAGADLYDVDDRNLDGIPCRGAGPLNLVVRGHFHITAFHERGLGRGATDVE